ncbi:acyl-CoA synthetase [Tsukamurella pulmonis]|uniref:Long-chain acyl-CoA synthetase n=1 Tax=Tsukamurella pulmonis TaxID=47312 RepID=A0A1H1ECV8_9ACTN|nr:AMP-binding protein [Tsukamurella pulmonis]KXO91995.1 acyl-CoA synthetase [Tsukamurella pulmonis]BDD82958.1 acyl-CoA synthetase [Tsukamurella pulmonis]SDQ86368.1 long-chain acyl-CoA synthetase [Tsukamurella pulmonis]SUP21052.1 Long-chain-fatty-acid--CoA ligase [Tsukamurella pulmonis]
MTDRTTDVAAALDAAADEIRALRERNWPTQVPRTVDYPAGTPAMVEHLRHWARERADTVAIAFYGREVSYAEYDEFSDRFAGLLVELGVRPGDAVGVYLGNCPQFAIAMLGILKAGAVHVPVNPLLKGRELQHELEDAGVGVLLAQTDLLELVESVRERTPVHTVIGTALGDLLTDVAPLAEGAAPFDTAPDPRSDWHRVVAAAPAPVRASDPDALAALNYTGGTTGLPKGCEHTQRHMAYTAATATLAGGTEVGDPSAVGLNFLPVFWIAGEDFGILKPLINGQTIVLMTRWEPSIAAALAARYAVTDMVATVDNYVELMDLPGFDGSALRTVVNPLAVSFVLKLTPAVRARWRELTGRTLREASYGMTETHTADTFTLGFQDGDRDLTADPVFCGLPVPGTDILVVDPDGAPVPVGETGEIVVRSESILTGYHRRPDATAEAIRHGWLHTGDVGKIDDWGAVHYLARTKEMIKVNGMSVFPSEVEALLKDHPAIGSVSVVPRPDERRGQVPLAFVVSAGPVDVAELTAWARENMAGYKVPDFVVVDALPMTATGKVRKGDLFERAARIAAEGSAK